MLQGMEEQGVDSKALLALYVKVYNDIIADHHDDMTVGIHLCRGNFRVRRAPLRSILRLFTSPVCSGRASLQRRRLRPDRYCALPGHCRRYLLCVFSILFSFHG